MSSKFQQFRDLHHSAGLFVLPNAWNAKSASIFQQRQFPAIATSSGAVSSSLGYADGENIPFSEYLFVINRILSAVQVPLTVDIEMGYGKSNEKIYENIQALVDLGVVGINIEDTAVINSSGRDLKEANLFAKTVEYVKNKLASTNQDLFINVRCDAFGLNVENKRQEAIHRLKTYEAAGADGIFLPGITADDIAEVVSSTKLPLNVVYSPKLPGIETLEKLGVKRVSMAGNLFNKVYKTLDHISQEIATDRNFSSFLA